MSAYTAIASQTLGSSASSVTFSSIPGTFRDLVLVVNGTITQTFGWPSLRINGLTSSIYSSVWMRGDGGSGYSGQESNQSEAKLTEVGIATNGRFSLIMNFLDYSTTDKHKSVLTRYDVAADGLSATASRCATTAAISSIQIRLIDAFGNSPQYGAGSTFSLYGVSA